MYILGTPRPLHTAIWKRVFAVLLTVLVSKTGQNLEFFCFFKVFHIDIPIFIEKIKQTIDRSTHKYPIYK